MADFVKRGSVQFVKRGSCQLKLAAQEVRGSSVLITETNFPFFAWDLILFYAVMRLHLRWLYQDFIIININNLLGMEHNHDLNSFHFTKFYKKKVLHICILHIFANYSFYTYVKISTQKHIVSVVWVSYQTQTCTVFGNHDNECMYIHKNFFCYYYILSRITLLKILDLISKISKIIIQ